MVLVGLGWVGRDFGSMVKLNEDDVVEDENYEEIWTSMRKLGGENMAQTADSSSDSPVKGCL